MATQDLLDIWNYIAANSSIASANGQLREIDRACSPLREWPELGKARDDVRDGLRSIRAGRYVIFYRVMIEVIEIVRVLHERRDVDTLFPDEEWA